MAQVVETRLGRLQGTSEDGLEIFRGIPFAKPPTGERRFRVSVPTLPGETIVDEETVDGKRVRKPR